MPWLHSVSEDDVGSGICQYRRDFGLDSIYRSDFPFLSQGGNSLLVLSVAVAFVLNIDASENALSCTEN